ncbi:hypothetical protein [Klenkia sp. PcliD-1-E]|uniref:hypothetical protein n=1 Tax=Klenkia sp. PcliD-1-E TaxID=2954492 RepID=UPI002096FBF7|nr:hypothetical protein [Klenkia sp. PcliD-1-E]MCO7222638.1 hypothetical protein [Klenkia sp. PcliD-1-E]
MTSREQRLQDRLALPVLVASLVSVPAVFLTFAPGVLGATGRVLDVATGAVLLGETVALLAVAEDKRAWVRGHRGLLAMTGVVVLGVVLAVGPVQVFRLVRTVGALRVLRAGRVVRATRTVAARTGGRLVRALVVVGGLVAALFVALVLADPTSRSRSLLDWLLPFPVGGQTIAVAAAVAGALVGGATWLLVRDPGSAADA